MASDHDVPDLQLTLGLVERLIALRRYKKLPDAKGLNRLRSNIVYLRRAGVPFPEKTRSPGSGTNLVYGFDEIAELALAFELFDRGMKPADVATLITRNRKALRAYCREAYERRAEQFPYSDPHGTHPEQYGQGRYLIIDITYASGDMDVHRFGLMDPDELVTYLFGNARSALVVPLSCMLEQVVDSAVGILEFQAAGRLQEL